jgi:hypothetical protein
MVRKKKKKQRRYTWASCAVALELLFQQNRSSTTDAHVSNHVQQFVRRLLNDLQEIILSLLDA